MKSSSGMPLLLGTLARPSFEIHGTGAPWPVLGGAPRAESRRPIPYAPFAKGPIFRTFRHPSRLRMSARAPKQSSNQFCAFARSFEHPVSKQYVDVRVLSVLCCPMFARQRVLPAHFESEEFPPTRSAAGILIPSASRIAKATSSTSVAFAQSFGPSVQNRVTPASIYTQRGRNAVK